MTCVPVDGTIGAKFLGRFWSSRAMRMGLFMVNTKESPLTWCEPADTSYYGVCWQWLEDSPDNLWVVYGEGQITTLHPIISLWLQDHCSARDFCLFVFIVVIAYLENSTGLCFTATLCKTESELVELTFHRAKLRLKPPEGKKRIYPESVRSYFP